MAEILNSSDFEKELVYTWKSTLHAGCIGVLFLTIIGISMLINNIKSDVQDIEAYIFAVFFTIFGLWISAEAFYRIYINPATYIFRADHNGVSWGIIGQEKNVRFCDVEKINVMMDGNIFFHLKKGEIIHYARTLCIKDRKDMFKIYQYLNYHFKGLTMIDSR